MEKQVFEKYDGSKVTESILQEAAQLFSAHYGVWSEHAAKAVGEFAKAGKLALDDSYCLLNDDRKPRTARQEKTSSGTHARWQHLLLREGHCG